MSLKTLGFQTQHCSSLTPFTDPDQNIPIKL